MTQNQFYLVFKNKQVAIFLLLFLCIKIILSYFIPVVGDETYYWVWGQNIQLSYFDHPPAVSWLTWISQQLITSFPYLSKEVLLRFPFVILSQLTFIIWIVLFNFEEKKSSVSIFYFSLFYFLNPLIGLGGLFVTPDIPLMFFIALSFFAVQNILKNQKTIWYVLLGIFLGLGFCSKYHIVILPLSLITYLLITKNLKLIDKYKILLTFLFGFLFSLPVLIWNFNNEWASFVFQLKHGLERPQYNLTWTVGYILGQILLFNPLLLYSFLKNTTDLFIRRTALFQWGFFLFSSFKALVEANWATQAHPIALLNSFKNIKFIKWALLYWVFIYISACLFLVLPIGQKKLNSLPQTIAAEEVYSFSKDFRPLWGPTYQMSSLLSFISKEKINKLKNLSRFDIYDTFPASLPDPSIKEFYVLKYTDTTWPDYLLSYKIEKIKALEKYKLELFKIVSTPLETNQNE